MRGLILAKRAGHSLVVPQTHAPYTRFVQGVPSEKVRELTPYEKKWDFWTTSTAFYSSVPKTTGIVFVPQGEVWVVERGGSFSRALEAGRHVLIPFIDKIKTVKLGSLISTGVIAPGVVSKSTLTNQDGAQVDAYCVVYFKVADFAKSAYFVDVESNKLDSERAAARTARKAMAAHIATLSVTDGQISTADQKSLEDKVMQALIAKQAKYGLEFSHVEVRGAFDVQAGVSDKIRALEAPHPDFEGPGHDLPNDYWQQHLTPAFFEKCTFGSYKVPKTPAAVSLEWSVPSPPDFHHFNEIPKLTVPPAETAEGKVIANAH